MKSSFLLFFSPVFMQVSIIKISFPIGQSTDSVE